MRTFSGTLKDSDGNNLSGVSLALQKPSTNDISSVTDSNGNFSVSVQPGMYSLKLSGVNLAGMSNFSVAQDTATPSIDLTSSNIAQDLVLPLGTINFTVYNNQGYLVPGAKVSAQTDFSTTTGSSVSLYPGSAPFVKNSVKHPVTTTDAQAQGSIKSIVGMRYAGTYWGGNICANMPGSNASIGCKTTPFVVASGVNAIDLP